MFSNLIHVQSCFLTNLLQNLLVFNFEVSIIYKLPSSCIWSKDYDLSRGCEEIIQMTPCELDFRFTEMNTYLGELIII